MLVLVSASIISVSYVSVRTILLMCCLWLTVSSKSFFCENMLTVMFCRPLRGPD